MALRDLKKGDKLYAVYNMDGFLFCDTIHECIVKKVITKDFVTKIFLENNGKCSGTRAVGYYLGDCALSEYYFFTTTDVRLKDVQKRDLRSDAYCDILRARNRLMQLIKEGK